MTGVSPNQPKTPVRALRLDDDTWDAVKAEAVERGITASDVVREALQEHLERQR